MSSDDSWLSTPLVEEKGPLFRKRLQGRQRHKFNLKTNLLMLISLQMKEAYFFVEEEEEEDRFHYGST